MPGPSKIVLDTAVCIKHVLIKAKIAFHGCAITWRQQNQCWDSDKKWLQEYGTNFGHVDDEGWGGVLSQKCVYNSTDNLFQFWRVHCTIHNGWSTLTLEILTSNSETNASLASIKLKHDIHRGPLKTCYAFCANGNIQLYMNTRYIPLTGQRRHRVVTVTELAAVRDQRAGLLSPVRSTEPLVRYFREKRSSTCLFRFLPGNFFLHSHRFFNQNFIFKTRHLLILRSNTEK